MKALYRQEVLAIRRRLNLTQRQFATRFGFPVATLRHWERGDRCPNRTALVLLCLIRDNPCAVRQAVLRTRQRLAGMLPANEPWRPRRSPRGFGRQPRIPI
jgi:DNA-binding XRE family transcriptional regulator